MKPGVVIVNTARGAVMDEDALVEALDKGSISSCGLDVFEEEPKIHPGLVANPRVMLLPHMGTWTEEVNHVFRKSHPKDGEWEVVDEVLTKSRRKRRWKSGISIMSARRSRRGNCTVRCRSRRTWHDDHDRQRTLRRACCNYTLLFPQSRSVGRWRPPVLGYSFTTSSESR